MLGAHGVLMDAYDTDVRAALADRRAARGLPRDPMAAYRDSGYGAADRRRPGRRHPGGLVLTRDARPTARSQSPPRLASRARQPIRGAADDGGQPDRRES